jgi:hypothetical protein
MNFRYGKSFQQAADDSVMEFNRRMSQEEVRRERERGHRSKSAPKMPPIRSRDEVKRTLNNCHDHKYRGMYHMCNSTHAIGQCFSNISTQKHHSCPEASLKMTNVVATESMSLTIDLEIFPRN